MQTLNTMARRRIRARSLTVAILALVGAGFVSRDWRRGVQAADAEWATWGASDPAWSPDGKRLAFTLFGSIWQVAAEGGVAEQLSDSAGYHVHPSWSPKGDKIVFLRSGTPRGTMTNESGGLVLLDSISGRERTLPTPYEAAGTPTWSPDGEKIVCGLRVPNVGSLLHEINLSDGRARQIQFRPERLTVGAWIDAAWSVKDDEIHFAGQHLGAPQIWSMPSGSPTIMIELPLTRYRKEDVVWLQGLSVIPDGSGIIYSADLQNGRGNYELYRIAKSGGSFLAIYEFWAVAFQIRQAPAL